MTLTYQLGDAAVPREVLAKPDHQLGAAGRGETLEGVQARPGPTPFIRAMADWVVPIRCANPAWVSPASVRSRCTSAPGNSRGTDWSASTAGCTRERTQRVVNESYEGL